MTRGLSAGGERLEEVVNKKYDIEVKAKKLYIDAKLPEYKTDGASGMDLFSYGNYIVIAGGQMMISTGIALSIPQRYEGQIRPRSGLAAKHEISITNSPGTIDSDYRGDISIILRNNSDDNFEVKKYDRVAQIIFVKVERAELKVVDTLDETLRADGGFGHTGR